MKPILAIFTLLLVTAGFAAAQVPNKPVPSTYRNLWQESPFTTKPVPVSAPRYNHLQDYVLMGVGPAEKGHRVSLLNSKRPKDGRIIIRTGEPNDLGIIIEEVVGQDDERLDDGSLAAKVRIKDASGNSALVGFDQKFLAIKGPAPAAASTPSPQVRMPSGANNGSNKRPTKRTLPPKQLGLSQEQLQQLRNRAQQRAQQQQSNSSQGGQSTQGRRPILPSSRGTTTR